MYTPALFNVSNGISTFLLTYKMSTLRNKNGEMIKKWNKENKSLFGKLLETRPEKRKRQARKSGNSQQISNESKVSSEAHWFNRIPEVNRKSAPRLIPNSKMVTPDRMLDIKQKQCNSLLDLKDSVGDTEQKSCNALLHSKDTASSTVTLVDNMHNNHSEVRKTVMNVGVLKLPDIIIRNMPTFPFQNKNPKTVTCDGHVSLQSANQENNSMLYPSVTRILSTTMSDSSRAALNRWQQKMIAELGEEGFLTYQRGLLEDGSRFHSVIHNFLSGTEESQLDLGGVEGCWHSVNDIVRDVADVRHLESHVVHPDLLYKGVIDCVASYKGKLVLIEWKRSSKQKDNINKTYDAPLQLSAYLGAMNFDAKYDIKVQGGLIVVAYTDGCPAKTFRMSVTECQKYWKMWLLRLQKYWLMQHAESNGIP